MGRVYKRFPLRLYVIFDIRHRTPEDQLAELSAPCLGWEPVTEALFEHPEGGLYGPTLVVDAVVQTIVVWLVEWRELPMLDHRPHAMCPEFVAEVSGIGALGGGED